MKKILVAVDFSEASVEAVRCAMEIGEKFGSRLLLLHIIHDPADTPGFYLAKKAGKKVLRNMEQSAQQMMEEFVAEHAKGCEGCEARVVPGLPAAQIVQAAEKGKVDLVVVGTRGRGGLERLMLGSVADKVIRSVPCPVLTVRGPVKKTSRKRKN